MTAFARRFPELESVARHRCLGIALSMLGIFLWGSASSQAASPVGEMEKIFLDACAELDNDHWACRRFEDSNCNGAATWNANAKYCASRFQKASYSQMYALMHKHCLAPQASPGVCNWAAGGKGWASKPYLTVSSQCDSFDKLTLRKMEKPAIFNVSHQTGRWQPSRLSAPNKPLVEAADGSISVGVRNREGFAVQVEQTNPLLYTSNAKSIADSDIASLASLKSLVAGAGSLIGKVLIPPRNTAQLQSFPLVPGTWSGGSAAGCRYQPDVNAATSAQNDVLDDAKTLRKKLLNVYDVVLDVQRFVRDTEQGRNGKSYDLGGSSRSTMASQAEINTLLDQLQSAVNDLEANHNVSELIAKIKADSDCSGRGLETDLKMGRKTVLDFANAVLGKRAVAIAALDTVDNFENRLVEATFSNLNRPLTPCDAGNTMLLPDAIDSPGWLKERKIAVSVKKDAALAKSVSSSKPTSLDSSATIQQKFWEYTDFAVAITKTDIDSPKFRALGDGGDPEMFQIASAGSDSLDGNLALLMDWRAFGQLCESRCSAQQYRIANLFGLQVGPTLVDGDVGLLAGISVGTKNVRLGYGWAWQSASRLDGQFIGDAVSGMDAIRTKNKRVEGEYISLSVSFGALSLFTK